MTIMVPANSGVLYTWKYPYSTLYKVLIAFELHALPTFYHQTLKQTRWTSSIGFSHHSAAPLHQSRKTISGIRRRWPCSNRLLLKLLAQKSPYDLPLIDHRDKLSCTDQYQRQRLRDRQKWACEEVAKLERFAVECKFVLYDRGLSLSSYSWNDASFRCCGLMCFECCCGVEE